MLSPSGRPDAMRNKRYKPEMFPNDTAAKAADGISNDQQWISTLLKIKNCRKISVTRRACPVKCR
jgi:hypothetical protein